MAEFVYPPVIASARAWFKLAGLKFDIVGTQNVPESGGAVLAINHVSYLDFIFAGLAADPSSRRVRFMAKQGVFKHPVAGPLMRGMRHIPVDRQAGSAAYKNAVEALRRGEVVGVFPEATISRAFAIKELKSGAARMASSAEVPLIPVVTFGGQRLMTKGSRHLTSRGVAIGITVGAPIVTSVDDDAATVTKTLKHELESLLDQTVARYRDREAGQGQWWMPAKYGGAAPTLEEAAHVDHADAAGGTARRAPTDK